MITKYSYKDLLFHVEDETNINFSIEILNNDNPTNSTPITGVYVIDTAINIPGDDDPEIEDMGNANIGKGIIFRDYTLKTYTYLNFIEVRCESIKVIFKLNGEIILEHIKPLSEMRRSKIMLAIKFPRS